MRSTKFKSRRHAATAQVLIEAAESAIARRGYDRVTMRDIAAECGCVAGTLYLYFKSKRDVVNAIVTRHSDLMHTAIMDALSSTADPLEKLRRATATWVDYFNQNRSFFKFIFARSSARPDKMLPTLPLRAQQEWQEVRKLMLDAIQQAQTRGRVRQDFPPETIWKFVNGVSMGFLNELSVQDKLPEREEQMRVVWGLMTGGIGAQEAQHAKR